MKTFTMTMQPAAEGDSLRLAWGASGEERHALIDLGRAKSFRAMRETLAATRRYRQKSCRTGS